MRNKILIINYSEQKKQFINLHSLNYKWNCTIWIKVKLIKKI